MVNFYEKIERYLLGELAESELAAFENALQSDATLAKSVTQHREMMQRLDALRLRNKVASALESRHGTAFSIPSKGIVGSLVLLLALLAGAIWFLGKPAEKPIIRTDNPPQNNQDVPVVTPSSETPIPIAEKPKEKDIVKPRLIALAREFQEQPAQTFVRNAAPQAGDSSPRTPAQRAAEAFYNQNFRLTADLLRDENLVQQDEEARYIRASARFNIGQFVGAAKDFDALKGSFQFKHEARWNYLLCQIALGKMEMAKALLAEMVGDQDFPFHSKAVELNKRFAAF